MPDGPLADKLGPELSGFPSRSTIRRFALYPGKEFFLRIGVCSLFDPVLSLLKIRPVERNHCLWIGSATGDVARDTRILASRSSAITCKALCREKLGSTIFRCLSEAYCCAFTLKMTLLQCSTSAPATRLSLRCVDLFGEAVKHAAAPQFNRPRAKVLANTLYKHLTHRLTRSSLLLGKRTLLRLGSMKDSSSRHALLTLLLENDLRQELQIAQSYLARYLWLLPTSLPGNQKGPIAHILLLNRRLNAKLCIHLCRSTPTTTPAAAAAISKAANVPASSMSSSASTTP